MGFTDAITFLRDYRKARSKALNNAERMKWSTQPLQRLDELFKGSTGKFDSSKENTDWEQLYQSTTPQSLDKYAAHRLKIAFLAGCRRDLRILMAAGATHRVRVPLDQDRFELSRLGFNRMKTDKFEEMVKAKET
jgi:hypothetical protein